MLPFKTKLQYKLLILFILISTLPLIISNLLWFNSSKNQILNTTSDRLLTATAGINTQVESYLDSKVKIQSIHSQTEAVKIQDIFRTTNEFKAFLNRDPDLYEITLLSSTGHELIRQTRDKTYPQNELLDQSSSQAYQVSSQNKQYISPVFMDEKGQPSIYISIPVLDEKTASGGKEATASATAAKGETKVVGVLKGSYHLTNLWKIVETYRIGRTGYVMIVDDKGNVIAHPNKSLAKQQKSLKGIKEVDNFLADLSMAKHDDTDSVRESKNEIGELSYTNHRKIDLTNWGIITQMPVSDTFYDTNQITMFTMILFLVFLFAVVALSLWVTEQIVKPVKQLQLGSNIIGRGDLKFKIDIKSGDEIEELGTSFNNMTTNLAQAFSKLEQDKNIIATERNKFSVALSSIADAIIAVDLKRDVIIFNKSAEELTGYTREQAVGKPVDSLFTIFEDKTQINPETFSPIRSDGFEGVVYTRKGLKIVGNENKEVFVNLTTSTIKDGVKANLGCILTMQNITKEKQLEDMKLDFVSMAAHELRTPLTSIRGYLSVLLEENKGKFSPEINMFLDRISISTEQLMSLVENLLSVSRIERGVLSVNTEPVDWLKLVQQTYEQLETRAKEKKIDLQYIKPTFVVPPIKADRLRITEVLANLAANAINYTQTGGWVKIWLEVKPGEVITHVSDNGQGIPEEAIPHLFAKFFRVSGKLEQGSKGTGLGLYISKAIVEMHKGKIWVNSVLGKGSTFSFSLPAYQPTIGKVGQGPINVTVNQVMPHGQ